MKTAFTLMLILIPFTCFAEEQADSADEPYEFKPMLLDGDDNSGAVLGISYRAEKKWTFCSGSAAPATNSDSFGDGTGSIADQLAERNCFAELKLEGIWANDKDINPESYSKLNLDIGYEILEFDDIDTPDNEEFDIDFGLQLAIEGDQNYEDSQTLVALQAGTMIGSSTDWYIAAIVSYGEVDASENETRMAITDVDKFDRVGAEIHIQYPLNFGRGRKYAPKALAFNYRYFGEQDAPDEIKAAELDEFQFGVIRLKFENGLFIGYAKGKLPFDVETESVLELGLTQNLF